MSDGQAGPWPEEPVQNPYIDQRYQYTYAPPPRPGSDRPLVIIVIIIVAALLLVSVFGAFVLIKSSQNQKIDDQGTDPDDPVPDTNLADRDNDGYPDVRW